MAGFCERLLLPPNYAQRFSGSAACWLVDQVVLFLWLRPCSRPRPSPSLQVSSALEFETLGLEITSLPKTNQADDVCFRLIICFVATGALLLSASPLT